MSIKAKFLILSVGIGIISNLVAGAGALHFSQSGGASDFETIALYVLGIVAVIQAISAAIIWFGASVILRPVSLLTTAMSRLRGRP